MRKVIVPKKSHAQRRRRGVMSVEYLLLLTFVVIPLGLLAPGIMKMIGLYTTRIFGMVGLPFG